VEDTVGRKCVCNGLMANIGYQQVRNGKREEVGLITAGDDLVTIARFLQPGARVQRRGCHLAVAEWMRRAAVDGQQILDPCDDVCFA